MSYDSVIQNPLGINPLVALVISVPVNVETEHILLRSVHRNTAIGCLVEDIAAPRRGAELGLAVIDMEAELGIRCGVPDEEALDVAAIGIEIDIVPCRHQLIRAVPGSSAKRLVDYRCGHNRLVGLLEAHFLLERHCTLGSSRPQNDFTGTDTGTDIGLDNNLEIFIAVVFRLGEAVPGIILRIGFFYSPPGIGLHGDRKGLGLFPDAEPLSVLRRLYVENHTVLDNGHLLCGSSVTVIQGHDSRPLLTKVPCSGNCHAAVKPAGLPADNGQPFPA